MQTIVRFEDKDALNPAAVGHKFVALARAHRAGFAVPPAVAIHTDVHRYFVQTSRWPAELLPTVKSQAETLGLTATGLSVRSSATLEDLAGRSFAGQYQSFLKIDTLDDLIKRIEACWLSIGNHAVQSYLAAADGEDVGDGRPAESSAPDMGVILQQMVPARVAGVAFGRDPMRPSLPAVVIEAVDGLAAELVSGSATPHRAEVDPDGTVRLKSGSRPDKSGANGILDDTQWRSIAAMVRSLESYHERQPLDIEWVIDVHDRLWLLQARRITSLHGPTDVPRGAWTRKIADDLWADRLTPLMTDVMLANAPHFDLSDPSKRLGLFTGRKNLTVINGYLYVNCDSLIHILSFIPPNLRLDDFNAMLPPSYDPDKIPAPSVRSLVRLGFKALSYPLFRPEAVPWICLRQSRRFQARLHRRLDQLADQSADSTVQAFAGVRQGLEMLLQIQVHNQFPYLYAALFTWLLRWWTVDICNRPHTEFLELISRGGRNISITIEREVRRMAARIYRDVDLRALFTSGDPEHLAAALPTSLKKELKAFLEIYGCRSRHRTLYVKRWAEAPEEVVAMIRNLVVHPRRWKAPRHTGSGPPATEVSVTRSGFSEAAKAPVPLRFRLLLSLARAFLDLREDLRFLLDKALFQIRRRLLETGRQVGLDDGILFLTLDEIDRLVKGELDDASARGISRRRSRRFKAPYAPPLFFVNQTPQDAAEEDPDIIRGLGTSPGRAAGRARIVEDPFSVAIEDGDILVARHTDPGWTPILSRVGGMIMEEGGLLNHCSIVARELGIPAVVGIANATQRIPEGAQVLVDGGSGLIRLQAPEKD